MSSLSPLDMMNVYKSVFGADTTGTVSTTTADYKSVLETADADKDNLTTKTELEDLKKNLTKNVFIYKLLDKMMGSTWSMFLPASFTEKRDEYEKNLNLVKVMITNFERFDSKKNQTAADVIHGITNASVDLLAGINNTATDLTAEERTGVTSTGSTTGNTTDDTTTTVPVGSFEYRLNDAFLGNDTGITALKDAFKSLVDLDPNSDAATEQLANMTGAATGDSTLTKQVNAVKLAVQKAGLQQTITTETNKYNALTTKYGTEGLALKAKIDGLRIQLAGYTAANELETKMFNLYDLGHKKFVDKAKAFSDAEIVLNNTNKSANDLVNYFFNGTDSATTSTKIYLNRLVSASYGSSSETLNRDELLALGEANTNRQPLITGLVDAIKYRKLERQLIEYDKAYQAAATGSDAKTAAKDSFNSTYATFKDLTNFNSSDAQVVQYQKLAKLLLDKSTGVVGTRSTATTSLWTSV